MTITVSTIVCFLAAALLALVTILAIRSGRILWYPAQIKADRSENPAFFWSLVVAQFVAVMALAWLAFN